MRIDPGDRCEILIAARAGAFPPMLTFRWPICGKIVLGDGILPRLRYWSHNRF